MSSYDGAVRALELLEDHCVRHGTLTVVNTEVEGRRVYSHLRSLGIFSMDFLLPITDQKPENYQMNLLASFLIDAFEAWMEEGNNKVKIRYFENIIKSLLGGIPNNAF